MGLLDLVGLSKVYEFYKFRVCFPKTNGSGLAGWDRDVTSFPVVAT